MAAYPSSHGESGKVQFQVTRFHHGCSFYPSLSPFSCHQSHLDFLFRPPPVDGGGMVAADTGGETTDAAAKLMPPLLVDRSPVAMVLLVVLFEALTKRL